MQYITDGGHCLFPYQSSLSNGSSRTSGIGSDVKHRSDDVIEGEDGENKLKYHQHHLILVLALRHNVHC